jgi:hypothetical protein
MPFRFTPILPALADELRTHLQGRHTGFLFESNRHTRYSTRMVQAIVTACTRTAGIQKRVYPHLLRHSIATILLDSGLVPIDQVQKFSHSIGFSGRQRSHDCQRRLPLYFPCAPSSQLRNLSKNNLNNIGNLKIYH